MIGKENATVMPIVTQLLSCLDWPRTLLAGVEGEQPSTWAAFVQVSLPLPPSSWDEDASPRHCMVAAEGPTLGQ